MFEVEVCVELVDKLGKGGNVNVVMLIGKCIVEKVKVVGIEFVVFDCLGFCYYGCVKVLVEVVCEVGFKF